MNELQYISWQNSYFKISLYSYGVLYMYSIDMQHLVIEVKANPVRASLRVEKND